MVVLLGALHSSILHGSVTCADTGTQACSSSRDTRACRCVEVLCRHGPACMQRRKGTQACRGVWAFGRLPPVPLPPAPLPPLQLPGATGYQADPLPSSLRGSRVQRQRLAQRAGTCTRNVHSCIGTSALHCARNAHSCIGASAFIYICGISCSRARTWLRRAGVWAFCRVRPSKCRRLGPRPSQRHAAGCTYAAGNTHGRSATCAPWTSGPWSTCRRWTRQVTTWARNQG